MEWLKSLGLNEKQCKLYLYLLEKGGLTASQLARGLGEQRTNIYLITDELVNAGLVERDGSRPVALFKVTSPQNLQNLMLTRQKQLAHNSSQMKNDLPDLLGLYHLHTAETGFAYFEGVKGYLAMLEDMVKSSQEVRVFGTAMLNDRPDLWLGLQKALQKRALHKIETKMILDNSLSTKVLVDEMRRSRVSLKFWGDTLFEGEVAIYGSTVVLTTYDEKLISLVIKNKAIAATFQSIFDTAWYDTGNTLNKR